MKTEILVRCYTPDLVPYQEQIADLIQHRTDYGVRLVDHTNLSLDDFDIRDATPVSIDRHLAQKFQIPYMRVSRVFDHQGRVCYRVVVLPEDLPEKIVLIDTDIVEGRAIERARKATGAQRYSVPLVVEPHQDLIDVEDLIKADSLFQDGWQRSYLCNQLVFSKRTSLPATLYWDFNDFLKHLIEEPSCWSTAMWESDAA